MKIKVATTVQAPIGQVWDAYTNPADICIWNAASDDWHTTKAEVDLRDGGRFCSRMEAKDGSFGFDFEGAYTKVITNQAIQYEFGGRDAAVTFNESPEGVEVAVTFDSEESHSVEQQREGWQAILNNFKWHVEARAKA